MPTDIASDRHPDSAQDLASSRQPRKSKRKDPVAIHPDRGEIRNQPFALILIFVALGITFDKFVGCKLEVGLTVAAIIAGWQVITRFLWQECKPQSRIHLPSLLLLAGWAAVGASWHHLHYHVFQANELGIYTSDDPTPVGLRAWVLSRPQIASFDSESPMDIRRSGEVQTRIIVRVHQIRIGQEWIAVSGKASVRVQGSLSKVSTGDELILFGHLSVPERRRSRREFCLREFYRGQRIHSTVFVNCTENIRMTGRILWRLWPGRMLDRVAGGCFRIIENRFTPDSAKMVRAVLFGERHQISKSDQHRYLVTGTMHLLAISGLHIGILASGWLMLIRLGIVPRTFGYWLTIGFVCLYCVLAGSRPPVFRATVLIVLFCLAKITGRNPVSVNSLCLAGLTVILINPVAIFRPGPQLSFVAVAVLIMIGDQVLRDRSNQDSFDLFLLRKRTAAERLRDRLLLNFRLLWVCSFGIWVATVPLVAEYFHVVSPIGIVANVVLMIPFTLFLNCCFMTLLFGLFGIRDPFTAIAECIFSIINQFIHFASEVPLGHWWSFGMGPIWLLVFYSGFSVFFFESRFRIRLRWQLTLALIWLAVALVASGAIQPAKSRLAVTFVDVGHGVCVLIEYPNGKAALYDAGCLSSSRVGVERISAVLWERKVERLEAIIISHADLDHYNAIPLLLERFDVEKILASPNFLFHPENDSLRCLSERIHFFGLDQHQVDADWSVEFDPSCRTEVLHPTSGFRGESDNANSLVIQIEYQGRSVLLTGDLELNGLEALVSKTPRNIDVMLAPHHGSIKTDHARLSKWANPTHVVVSSGKKTMLPEIGRIYRRHLSSVHSTANSGTIRFELSAGQVSIDRYLKHQTTN